MRIIEPEQTTLEKEFKKEEPTAKEVKEPKDKKDPYACFADSLAEIAKDLYDLSFKLNKISGAILNFGEHEG